ncbi:MAG: helix-turn-helix transcriptional regulator [Ruminococcaceae bacterium]|nr:helix-turn-helix transcriptional regulator [Oscillospiraceae bacterium]
MKSKYYINLFCENIKYLRKKHNLSKAEMAKRLNVGIGSITSIENGILPPRLSARVLITIEESFNVSASKILSVNLSES